ncbi:MAG: FAD-dependent oxidoreductase, partial [Clostridia bacterium]|nr:FAD-dependent oxidoreductase [Clostridia bacterium]
VNMLDFLMAYKSGKPMQPGSDPVVIGAGNSAMDAARAAMRHEGVKRCRIVYRRTRRYMPADEEELRLALDEGVELLELLSPLRLEDGALVCKKCVLGEPDASGRRAPVETEELLRVPCTMLIAATGESVDTALFTDCGAALDARGRVTFNPDTLETSAPNIYVVGDARRGPATVVEGIADARRAADAIAGKYEYAVPAAAQVYASSCYEKQGILKEYDCAGSEAGRCLGCSTICTLCAQVCPNRANVAVSVPGSRMPQILHIDRMCNECGNCLVFCPYDSAPYKEKFTLFDTEAAFDASENPGFLPLGGDRVKLRLDGVRTVALGEDSIDENAERLIRTVLAGYSYLV